MIKDFYISSAGDWLRLLIFVACTSCLIFLAIRFVKRRKDWNAKTRDYWFAMTTWSLAGAAIGVQGIYEHIPISPRTVLVTVAALVTLNGLRRQGGWGDEK